MVDETSSARVRRVPTQAERLAAMCAVASVASGTMTKILQDAVASKGVSVFTRHGKYSQIAIEPGIWELLIVKPARASPVPLCRSYSTAEAVEAAMRAAEFTPTKLGNLQVQLAPEHKRETLTRYRRDKASVLAVYRVAAG